MATTFKMLGVGFLILILWASSFFVSGLVGERSGRQEEVHQEIALKWGAPGLVAGPIITVPYERTYLDNAGITRLSREIVYLLPETLNIDGKIIPTQKKRGIYSSTVYTSELNFAGNFNTKLLEDLGLNSSNFVWNEAFVSLSLTDTRGIGEAITLNWAGKTMPWKPGSKVSLGYDKAVASGLHSKIVITGSGNYNFDFVVNISGSRSLEVVPVGKETKVNLASSWPSPSFIGAFLPTTSTVDKSGFEAKWQVSSLGRSYPDAWTSDNVSQNIIEQSLPQSALGVNLLKSVDFYTLVDRTTKYAILFIALTFLSFFLFESIAKLRIHPMQYLLVGIALVLFYLLLLSFAENIGFAFAYLLASALTVALIWTYSRTVLKTGKRANLIAGILIALYVYLYIILQLEELALLGGSVLLFAVLAIVMQVTKKIDWYRSGDTV